MPLICNDHIHWVPKAPEAPVAYPQLHAALEAIRSNIPYGQATYEHFSVEIDSILAVFLDGMAPAALNATLRDLGSLRDMIYVFFDSFGYGNVKRTHFTPQNIPEMKGRFASDFFVRLSAEVDRRLGEEAAVEVARDATGEAVEDVQAAVRT